MLKPILSIWGFAKDLKAAKKKIKQLEENNKALHRKVEYTRQLGLQAITYLRQLEKDNELLLKMKPVIDGDTEWARKYTTGEN